MANSIQDNVRIRSLVFGFISKFSTHFQEFIKFVITSSRKLSLLRSIHIFVYLFAYQARQNHSPKCHIPFSSQFSKRTSIDREKNKIHKFNSITNSYRRAPPFIFTLAHIKCIHFPDAHHHYNVAMPTVCK